MVIFTGIFLISLQLAGIDFGASRQAQIEGDAPAISFRIGGGEEDASVILPSNGIVTETNITILGKQTVETGAYSIATDDSNSEIISTGDTLKLAKYNRTTVQSVDAGWQFKDMTCRDGVARLNCTNQTLFSEPVRIDDAAGNDSWARSPEIALGGDGKIFVAWTDKRDGDWDVYYSSSEDGGRSFIKNTRLGNQTAERYRMNPMVGIDERGAIHMIWVEKNQSLDIVSVRYAKSVDGGVSFGPAIDSGGYINSMTIDKTGVPYLSLSCCYTKLADDESGFVKLVPMYSELNASTRTLSGGNLIVDNDGVIQAVFHVESKGVIYARSEDGFNFANTLIADQGFEPYIAMDGNGTIFAAWWTGTGVHVSEKVQGEEGFRELGNVSAQYSIGLSSPPAIDSNGILHFVWMGEKQYATYSARDGWNLRTNLPVDAVFGFPRVLVDRNDTVHIVYESYSDATGMDVYYLRGTRTYWTSGEALSPVTDLLCVPSDLRISENLSCPVGTSTIVYSRASGDNVSWTNWGPCDNGVPRLANRYMQLKYEFWTENTAATPVLYGASLEYSHYAPRGSVVSSLGLRENIISATISGELTLDGQTVVLSLSNDNGSHWYEAAVNVPWTFPTRGQQLGFRAIFLSNGSSTGSLKNFNISYTVESYPTNPAVYVGDGGAAVWSQFGTFNSTATLPDLSGVFNEYIASHRNQSENGTVAVPIRFASDTCGIINVTEFDIVYNVPPRIASREPDKPSVTAPEGGSIHFVMNATDDDSDLLTYQWYLDGSPAGGNSSVFDYRPGYESAGNHTLAVKVADGRLDLASSWNVTIENVNRQPVVTAFTPRSPVTVVIGNAPRFNVQAFDPDNDTLAFSWTLDGKGTAGNGSALILGTSGIGPGRHVLKVHISDGTGSAEQAWTVDVRARNGVESDPVPYLLAGALIMVLVAASVYLFKKRGKKKEP